VERQRIVVVEDDMFTTKLLGFTLADAGYQVDTAHTRAAALIQIEGRPTALVLLDIQLADSDGFTLVETLRVRHYRGPIIVLSGQRGLDAKLTAFAHGADDYVTKPFEPRELLARVAAVLRRARVDERQSSDLCLHVDDAHLDLATLTYTSAAVLPTALAPTEVRVLDYLMRHAHTPVTRETLNACVWGAALHGDLNRVDVYIRRVRRRIEADPTQPRYLRMLRGRGYVFGRSASTDDRANAAGGM
jgi:DNA-binding response OmpR family regulator